MTLTASRPLSRPLAAFDFDGTLTWTDSFTAFLLDACGAFRVALAFGRHPSLLLDYARTGDRGALKARLIFLLLGPVTLGELGSMIARFVERKGMGLFRPDALETWHSLADSHERVIVTASPDILVAPLAALIGADLVIGTRLGFGEDGRLRPELNGVNCRGEEKMRRLREVFGDGLDLDLA
ncbi:MAG: HAD-IB family phosphatase, partial [Asticcacaulis sp.]